MMHTAASLGERLAPTEPVGSPRNSGIICSTVILGTYLVVLAISMLLVFSLSVEVSVQAIASLLVCGVALSYIVAAHLLLRRGRHLIVSYMLISFYMLLAVG